MEILISCLLIVLAIYLFWLWIFVFRFDVSEFFTWKKNPAESVKDKVTKQQEQIEVIRKPRIDFIEKMPEVEPVKPYRVEPLPLKVKEEPELLEDEVIVPGYLSEEEKKAIVESEFEPQYWEDSDEFAPSGDINDFYYAAEVISGQKKSEEDISKTGEILKDAPEELIELFALHAANDQRIKDMLDTCLEEWKKRKQEDAKTFRQAVKEFVVEDYIA